MVKFIDFLGGGSRFEVRDSLFTIVHLFGSQVLFGYILTLTICLDRVLLYPLGELGFVNPYIIGTHFILAIH
jgi:hypothetical protein